MHDNLLNSLPIVASAIGRRCGVAVEIGGNEASTCGDTICLPSCQGVERDVTLGYLVHECGHVRFSDFSLLGQVRNEFERHVFNAYEDVRVEREMCRIYPGALSLITKTMAYLVDNHPDMVVDENDPNVTAIGAIAAWIATDCWYKHRQMPSLLKDVNDKALVVVQKAIPQDLIDQLAAINDEVAIAKTSKDCLTSAQKVLDLLSQYTSQQNQNQTQGKTDNPNQAQAGDSNQGQTDDSNQGKAGNPNQGATDDSNQDKANDSNQGKTDDQNSQPNGKGKGSKQSKDLSKNNPMQLDSFNPDNKLDISSQMKEKLDNAKKDCSNPDCARTVGVSDIEVTGNLSEHRKALIEDARRYSVGLRRQLQGLVQAKARTQVRTVHAGQRIATSKLSRLQTWNTRVFTKRTVHESTASAVHILLDMSGSMNGAAETKSIEASIALFTALSGLEKCNPAFSIFQSGYAVTKGVLRHGEKLNVATAPRLDSVYSHGSTPLAEALLDVAYELAQTKERRKVVIVVTDGMPNDGEKTLRVIKQMERSGIELMGIGIDYDVTHLFPKSVYIKSVKQLQGKMFELAKDSALLGIH